MGALGAVGADNAGRAHYASLGCAHACVCVCVFECMHARMHVCVHVCMTEGFEAWWNLVRRSVPCSMARAVRVVGLVTSSPIISDLTEVETQIRKCDDNRRTLVR